MLKIGSVYKWHYWNYTLEKSDGTIYHMKCDSIFTILDFKSLHGEKYLWETKFLSGDEIVTIYSNYSLFDKVTEIC